MLTHSCIAVVSPFLDKKHGTERRVTELISRLARDYNYEVHIYSQRIEDLTGVQDYQHGNCLSANKGAGTIWWHNVPKIAGPGILQYVWWFTTNQLWRCWDRQVRGIEYDMVYTPGLNCFDADAISVHIVFAEFCKQVKNDLNLWDKPISFWPWFIHRQAFYQLMILLERLIYTRTDITFTVIAHKVTADLHRFYHRQSYLPVIYLGIDTQQFNPTNRTQLRSSARSSLGLSDDTFVLLLIGNDWYKKGLPCLLQAINQLQHLNLQLIVAGQDQSIPYQALIEQYHLQGRVQFLPPRPDVQFYYAAADAYVAPSREDAFAQPPIEAMACGLPTIVSRQAGASELITDGVNGLILENPTNYQALADLIERLYKDIELREQLSKEAVKTTKNYTWDRNAIKMHMVFQEILLRKRQLLSKTNSR